MATGRPPVTKTRGMDLWRPIILEPQQVALEADGRLNLPMHQPEVRAPVLSRGPNSWVYQQS